MIVTQNADNVKTPNQEAFRLFRVVTRMVTDGAIDKRRECELQERIVFCIGRKDDDATMLTKLAAIERVLLCVYCGGAGVIPVTTIRVEGGVIVAKAATKCRCGYCGG